MPSFAAQQSLFRAYDIRGPRQHFTDDFIHALGHAFAHLYQAQQNIASDINSQHNSQSNTQPINKKNIFKSIVVIGHDVRCSSDTIARMLATILTEQGLQVIQLGLVTTPMMAFWAEQYHGHGIIVTASHSAKDILGVKWLVAHLSPSSADIQALYQQLSSQEENKIDSQSNIDTDRFSHSINPPSTKQVAIAYIEAISQVFTRLSQRNQRSHQTPLDALLIAPSLTPPKLDLVVVIDCMHGATSNIAQPLFEHFCQRIIMINDTPDGYFPLGNPDPTEPNRLRQLQQAVTENKADIGLAFDGDGDRLMVVNEIGKVVMPDHLLYLLANAALSDTARLSNHSISAKAPVSQVLFDIKCSHHLPKLLTELGAMPIISKTGSSLMRQQMQHSDSPIVFAGELSGHFIFNDNRFIIYDDAMYAALRLLHWLAAVGNHRSKKSLTAITQSLPALVSTADHYLPIPQTIATDCSIVKQLTKFCQYLQQLVDASCHTAVANDSLSNVAKEQNETNCSKSANQQPIPCESSRCTCHASRELITAEQARHLLPVGTRLSCIDGVRLDFAHGFGVIRQSNTSNNLTARFAGDSIEDLKDIQKKFAALCRPFDKNLAEQIAAIPAE
ncbi:phosphomannomutase [Psychrobacter sp. APC 3426]|uniref:phosphomannomutase n=1 Tax=Psychrobacter sp. APC 3426 TaxID=3035177 RepID=UPI0025B5E08F|nr:phosphomannomutase [Psychrobacter sp. APC 3426]MDN3398476.1 phosphomannomutase [Psychrobacter sp. APC 3426]